MIRFKLATAFFSLLLIVACSKKKSPADSSVGAILRGDIIQRVTVSGTVVPNRKAVVTPPYNGYIKKIFVQLGQKVLRDDPIVSLTQSLRGEETSFPLRAPFSGTVVQLLRSEGEYVKAEASPDTILRIDDTTRLFVESNIPETDIGKVKSGQEAMIRLASGDSKVYKGILKYISLAAADKGSNDRARVEFLVRIEVVDFDARIRPGMSTIVDVVTEQRKNVLTLRHEFIHKEGDKTFFVLPTGEKKAIQLGLENEEASEILSGAAEGDQAQQVDFLKLLPET